MKEHTLKWVSIWVFIIGLIVIVIANMGCGGGGTSDFQTSVIQAEEPEQEGETK